MRLDDIKFEETRQLKPEVRGFVKYRKDDMHQKDRTFLDECDKDRGKDCPNYQCPCYIQDLNDDCNPDCPCKWGG